MSLSIKPNVEALNEPNHITVKSLRYYSSETNSIDGFVNQVKTWRSFDVSASIHEIEIPTLILHTAGDERAGHTKASKLKDCERIGKPLCDFREIEGDYSHLLPYETPEKFCSAVTEFVTNERVSASCRRLWFSKRPRVPLPFNRKSVRREFSRNSALLRRGRLKTRAARGPAFQKRSSPFNRKKLILINAFFSFSFSFFWFVNIKIKTLVRIFSQTPLSWCVLFLILLHCKQQQCFTFLTLNLSSS